MECHRHSIAQADAGGVRLVNVTAIRPNPHQPRATFDQDALAELAAAVGSRPAPLADRQAGAIALTDLGRPARLVASPSACWVISAVA